MKTAPFDLIKYFNNEPVIFRNGKKPLDVIYSEKVKRLIAFISADHTVHHNETGHFHSNDYEFDLLIEIPVIQKSCWVNIYGPGKIVGGFVSEYEANRIHNLDFLHSDRKACINISWEE